MAARDVADILKIIEASTTNAKREIDQELMKQLKQICKLSDDYVNYSYYALMTQLRKNHAEIRYSTLLVMNELFIRSSAFRKLLESDLEEFLELVVETNPEYPLPLPKLMAKELKLKGLQFVKEWSTKFGVKCKRLNLAFNYLKSCKSVDFNDLEARNVAQRERHRQELESRERLISEKISKIRVEMQDVCDDIMSILTQTENCFCLLVPHPLNFFEETSAVAADEKTGKCEAVQENAIDFEESLREHGMYDRKSNIVIEIKKTPEVAIKMNEDTSPILETLKDLHRQITNKYFPLVSKWLKVLGKGSNCTDVLKKAIDLKQLLVASLEKYKELKINTSDSKGLVEDGDEDDEFEEVQEKEGYEPNVPEYSNAKYEAVIQPSCSYKPAMKKKPSRTLQSKEIETDNDPTSSSSTVNMLIKKYGALQPSTKKSKESSTDSKRSELLSKAPLLPYDIDLYHWEEEKPLIPEVVKFDAPHSFWASKNDSEDNIQLQQAQLASLRQRKIDFSGKFEAVKWACRAPLPSGKLCPRRDRVKCPFHGKIVKRDLEGNVVDAASQTSEPAASSGVQETPDWQDPELLRDIEAATGINLKMPERRKRKSKSKASSKSSPLTNIKVMKNSVRDRLSKKILKRYKHYARKLDEMEKRKFNDKFGDQWNYY